MKISFVTIGKFKSEECEKLVAQYPESPVLNFHLAVAYNDLAVAYNDKENASRAHKAFFTAIALGVQQRILSPRDTKILADLKARYMASELTSVADHQPSDASRTRQ